MLASVSSADFFPLIFSREWSVRCHSTVKFDRPNEWMERYMDRDVQSKTVIEHRLRMMLRLGATHRIGWVK